MNPFKITIIAIAAYMMIALNLFLEVKQFVLPIGLFKPTFFVLTIAMLGLVITKRKLNADDWMLIAWTALISFSSKFFLDIVIGQQAMDQQENAILLMISLAHIVAYLLLLLWVLSNAWKSTLLPKTIQIIGGLGMFACLFLDYYIVIIIPSIIWFTGVVLDKAKTENYYGMSVFLVFTIVSTWLTGYFFGAEAVLNQL